MTVFQVRGGEVVHRVARPTDSYEDAAIEFVFLHNFMKKNFVTH